LNIAGKRRKSPMGSRLLLSVKRQGVPFACTEGVCGTCVIEVVKGWRTYPPLPKKKKTSSEMKARKDLPVNVSSAVDALKIKF
jgi:ferredoxin